MPKWIKLSGLARCGSASVCSENRCLEVTFLLNLKSCGRPWSYRTTFSTIPRSRDEKSSKMTSKWRLRSTFRAALASFGLHFAGSAVTWQALCALFAKSSDTLCGKVGFSYIDTTPHEMLCFEGPSTQVGATWTEKSRPIGTEWPRSGKSEGSRQSNLVGQFSLAGEVIWN